MATETKDVPDEAIRGRVPREKLSTFAWTMALAVVTSSLGDVALKRGVSALPVASGILASGLATARNPWVVGGIVLMVAHFAAFVKALRLGPLSLVVPLRSSTYIMTTLLAQYFLREVVTPLRWVGILVILAGVSMVGVSGGRSK